MSFVVLMRLLEQLMLEVQNLNFCNTPHHFEHMDDLSHPITKHNLGLAHLDFCNTPHHFGHIHVFRIVLEDKMQTASM